MTVEEYRRERAELRTIYGDTKQETSARADQALAVLFVRSKWTQEELAAEEHQTRGHIACRVCFGKFLQFVAMATKPESGQISVATLTERRFRAYWARTDAEEKNDRIRFQAVLKLMEAEATFSKSHHTHKAVGHAIKATCADGTWHKLATIIGKVQAIEAEATRDQVVAVLKSMIALGSYNVFAEKHKGGDLYRIVLGGHQKIDLHTLKQELRPIIDGLKAEGKKNMSTMSPGTVAHLTCQLEKVLDRLAGERPEGAKE